jgi:hypothetical protein
MTKVILKISLFVLFQIAFNVITHAFFGIKYPEMPFAKNIRIEAEQFLHGFFPDFDVGVEIPVKWPVDILPEENSFARPVQIKRN